MLPAAEQREGGAEAGVQSAAGSGEGAGQTLPCAHHPEICQELADQEDTHEDGNTQNQVSGMGIVQSEPWGITNNNRNL